MFALRRLPSRGRAFWPITRPAMQLRHTAIWQRRWPMAPKRAAVPNTAFGRAPGALEKLTGRAPVDDTALAQDSETVTSKSRNTVLPSGPVEERVNSEKFTIYISPDKMDKLDELALAYRK